jgi:peptidoglycan/LPS O-acetylase OafA/YrhL
MVAASGRNPEIEVLRGVAVVLVILNHAEVLLPWHRGLDWDFGGGLWCGVDLFFCISGYVIARSLLPRLRDATGDAFWREAGAFWIRRFFRLAPSAWLWLAIPILLSAVTRRADLFGHIQLDLADATAAVLHVANFHWAACAAGQAHCGVLSVYWSLSVEEQFYLAFPFAAVFAGRFLPQVLGLGVVLQFFLPRPQFGSLLSFVRTDAIMLGVVIALAADGPVARVLAPRFLDRAVWRPLPFMLLALMVGAARYAIVPFHMGIVAVLAAGLVWIASFDRGFLCRAGWRRGLMGWIGERSYSLYLIHLPTFWIARAILTRVLPPVATRGWAPDVFVIATAAPLLILLVEANLRIVERPLRRYGRRVAEDFEYSRILDCNKS